MRSLLTLPLLLIPSIALSASIGIGADSRNIDFDGLNFDSKGASLSLSLSNLPLYFEASYLEDSDREIDYFEITAGTMAELFRKGPFAITGRTGIGYGWLDIPAYRNSNSLLSIPAGIKTTYSLSSNLSLYADAEYRWYFDLTDETKCSDGSTSNSTGSGSCSWHGGVSYQQDKIGDGDGLGLRAGIQYNF